MNTLKILGTLLATLVLLGAGGFVWARGKSNEILDRRLDVHRVDFPVPFPLDPAEIERAGYTPAQSDSAALARAMERGRHLVDSRFACTECHGEDFGGGVMVDDPMIGTLLGPNITSGAGGRVVSYTPSDWDRIVRHGLLPDGRPGAMPAQDFQGMSDQELSDIVVLIRSAPPVDAEVEAPTLGPLGTVLMATGQIVLAYDEITDHERGHATLPPVTEASAEFGAHLATVCTGCHKADLSGGKVGGGDPSWPAAANLTPVAGAFGDWTYQQFVTAMTEGTRPDGRALVAPMDAVVGYTSNMTETERQALWAYLRSIPAQATEG